MTPTTTTETLSATRAPQTAEERQRLAAQRRAELVAESREVSP